MILSSFIKRTKIFFKMDLKIKILFIRAFILTGLSRYSILNKSFRDLKDRFGECKKESSYVINEKSYKKARQISSVVRIISKYTPWESLCLVQAMTAQKLLERENIGSTLYLGVSKSSEGIKAHAWIRCGEYYVTGGSGEGFVEVAKFSNEELIKNN